MKLAIFDIDGTLVDSQSMIAASLGAAFASESLAAPPRETMMSIVGLSLVDAMRALAPLEEMSRHLRLAEAYKAAFWKFREDGAHIEMLFEGARETLERLRSRQDVILGIATGKSLRGVTHLLAKNRFEGWFATIQTSDTHPSKPHPSMVIQALADTGIEAHLAVVIGDTSYDMEMACAAGAGALGVTWGNHPQQRLKAAGAQRIASDFIELESGLDAIWEARPA